MLRLSLWPLLAFLLLAARAADDPAADPGIDALWAETSRAVQEGDYAAYAALFHDDAVFVNVMNGASMPIGAMLAKWKPGFDDTAAGRMTADVEFRFTNRIHGDDTAYETGIFAYHWQPEGEERQTAYVHFDALLVRRDGAWKMLMELQRARATEEEWNAVQ